MLDGFDITIKFYLISLNLGLRLSIALLLESPLYSLLNSLLFEYYRDFIDIESALFLLSRSLYTSYELCVNTVEFIFLLLLINSILFVELFFISFSYKGVCLAAGKFLLLF